MKRWIPLAALLLIGCADDTGEGEPLFGDDTLLVDDKGNISLSQSDSEPVIFTVPEGASSFAVIMTGLGGTAAQPATIKSPDGTTVFEVGATPDNRSDAYPHVQTTMVPVNPDVDVVAGDWEFVFFAAGSTSADIQALYRVQSAGGTLDVNAHFVGLEVLDASTAPDDADFQAVMSQVASVYSSAGVTLGDIEYFDVDNEAYAVLETTAVGSNELLDLLEDETDDRDNRAINLFFVADIENPGSSRSLLGVSGGVPGPGPLHGTKRSGVAINMANFIATKEGGGDMTDAVAEASLITAHEIGHYLGLFHTTEANGEALAGGTNGTDPIGDTPVCADSSDGDGDGVLSSSECSGADGSNLMFWSPPNGATTLTSGQRSVVSRNPVVQ